ncbi:hypothetical protein ABW19_dt0200885 [Dactylella cylindrospora]|nr:hypothetical protein ABW19_dt0200885 [Dactylella cylindrospora]
MLYIPQLRLQRLSGEGGYWGILRGGEASSTTPQVELRVYKPQSAGQGLLEGEDDYKAYASMFPVSGTMGFVGQVAGAALGKTLNVAKNAAATGLGAGKDVVVSGANAGKNAAGTGLKAIGKGALSAGLSVWNKISGKKPATEEVYTEEFEDEYNPGGKTAPPDYDPGY